MENETTGHTTKLNPSVGELAEFICEHTVDYGYSWLSATREQRREACRKASHMLAADDLLAATEEILADLDTLNEPYRNEAICERLRAAIAQAKGGASC